MRFTLALLGFYAFEQSIFQKTVCLLVLCELFNNDVIPTKNTLVEPCSSLSEYVPKIRLSNAKHFGPHQSP